MYDGGPVVGPVDLAVFTPPSGRAAPSFQQGPGYQLSGDGPRSFPAAARPVAA